MKFAAYMFVSFITLSYYIGSILYNCIDMVVCFACFRLIL